MVGLVGWWQIKRVSDVMDYCLPVLSAPRPRRVVALEVAIKYCKTSRSHCVVFVVTVVVIIATTLAVHPFVIQLTVAENDRTSVLGLYTFRDTIQKIKQTIPIWFYDPLRPDSTEIG